MNDPVCCHRDRRRWALCLSLVVPLTPLFVPALRAAPRTYPGRTWETKQPSEVGLNPQHVEKVSELLRGRGCIIRHGYVVKTWGEQSRKGDWMSSSKPVFSTLLFFAVQEGKLDSVHAPIKRFGWNLRGEDEAMTFHHLANMVSGYARPEGPGAAWAYNDYAINLYRLTLFNRLFQESPAAVANAPQRLGPLQFEDGLSFSRKARVVASVRDFGRLCWFWLNKGAWGQEQLLSRHYFEQYCRPHVPKGLPHTADAKTDDYLVTGTYGGGSDHFTEYGPGIYGYNFWFNDTGRDHPDRITWPDAPRDTFMTVGAGGNSAAIMPSLGMVVVAAKANWGNPKAGDPTSAMNRVMKLAAEAVSRREDTRDDENPVIAEGLTAVLLEDDFSGLRTGLVMNPVGAHTEYHYLPHAAQQGNWAVSAFKSYGSQRAWRVIEDDGGRAMLQSYKNNLKHTHPMLVAGDPLWRNYRVTADLAPASRQGQSGIVFRYRNDRCYYFFGVDGPRVILKLVRHAEAFHRPFEKVLAETPHSWTPGRTMNVQIDVDGSDIRAKLGSNVTLRATDATFALGRIGLMSDVPARYRNIKVTTTDREKAYLEERMADRSEELRRLQAANPRPVVWRKIDTEGFGVGRNLRFGDLDNDGQTDVLVGQVLHHGPKDRNSELSCLTAVTLDGKTLWQIGEPDQWKDHLTNDVGFQIHDLDGDGQTDVVYCMGMEIVVADGASGRTKYKVKTPKMPEDIKAPYDKFPRILGDSLFFCDVRGTGHPRDIIIKTRYRHFWLLNDRLEVLWHAACNTGHYPYACDVDGDGKDEISMGYSLFDDDGTLLWTLDNELKDHADGVAIVRFKLEADLRLLCAASDEGMFFADMQGKILKHRFVGHVQNPAIANFRDDLPGLEAVSINFWGNQGIIHFFDAEGDIYYDFEPCQHGSMCLPINWTGSSEEYFVLSASPEEGGLFDGWGRRVVR
ncbi:MAG: serine hydrolase domain-containing protein, partial [Planctomycetota bacterium]